MPPALTSDLSDIDIDSPRANVTDLEKEHSYLDQVQAAKLQFRRSREKKGLVVSLMVNAVILLLMLRATLSQFWSPIIDPHWAVEDPLYSPAQHVIKYERRLFNVLGEKTKYHGPPNDDVDNAWNSLYPVGETRISKADADRIANRTDEIPGDDGHFIVTLDVFHEIHCLNVIRKAFYPERYGDVRKSVVFYNGEWIDMDHVDHCLNIIRESLMCSADITPNVWHWDDRINLSFPHFDSVHTCRNWEAISHWAAEHKMLKPYDQHARGGHFTVNSSHHGH